MSAGTSASRPVAAVITEWRKNSHADVILGRLLEPEAWGHTRPFNLRLAAVYADQFPANDLCRTLCARHGVPIFPTIMGAVGVGTRAVPVDGVIVVGEHGQYPSNARRQKLYPRHRLFDEVVHAFRVLGRRVPVFSDKHLSYDWLLSRWMVDLARHEQIPLMAGSSLPVAWRVPPLTLPVGVELRQACALGYGDLDAYGFHALEMLQCMVERRSGGETGVDSVRTLSGPAVWQAADQGLWSRELLAALEPSRRAVTPRAADIRPTANDALFLIRYCDGLDAAVAMLGGTGPCFGFAARRRGVEAVDATVFDLQDAHPFGHFGYLLRAVESMIETGRPPYPVERTLLTTGLLAALLQSRLEGGTTIATPHLAALRYAAVDWPFAPGPTGTPA